MDRAALNGTLYRWYFENSVFVIWERSIPFEEKSHVRTSESFDYCDETWTMKAVFHQSVLNLVLHNHTRERSSRKETSFLIQLWMFCAGGTIVKEEREQKFSRSQPHWKFDQYFHNLTGKLIVCCRIFCTEHKELTGVETGLQVFRNYGLQALSDALNTVVETREHSDVVLKLGDVTFPAHKVILSCRSRVFEAMFYHDDEESRNNVVDLVDMDVAVAKIMLKNIYTGEVDGLSVDNMIDLYSVADGYCLMDLLDQCREFIIDHMNVDKVCDVAILADIHSDDDLMNKVEDFFCTNIERILHSGKREVMFGKYYDLYIKLVETTILRNKYILSQDTKLCSFYEQ